MRGCPLRVSCSWAGFSLCSTGRLLWRDIGEEVGVAWVILYTGSFFGFFTYGPTQ